MSRRQHVSIILLLGSLSTISPFSIDMYLPGFPAIARNLRTSIAEVQLSLTAYLVGIAVGQLLYGPLLDRFGRKKPLYAGLFVYVLASIGCAFSPSIEVLILMRLLQALGGCVGLVAAQALVRDLFPVDQIAQVFSLLTLVIAVSPMIAPTVGGYAIAGFGWPTVFVILALITVLILVGVYFGLPDGRPGDASLSLRPKAVTGSFLTVLKQPQFLTYALVGGIATAAPFAYLAGSSDIFMNQFHLSARQYGWVFAFLSVAFILPTQLNRFLLKRFRNEQLIQAVLSGQLIVGSLLVVGVWQHWYGLYGLIGMLFLFFCGQGITGPNASALSLAPFVRHAGSAAALMGSFRMAAGAVVSGSVSALHNNTAVPMVGIMLVCIVIGFIVQQTGARVIAHRSRRVGQTEPTSEVLL